MMLLPDDIRLTQGVVFQDDTYLYEPLNLEVPCDDGFQCVDMLLECGLASRKRKVLALDHVSVVLESSIVRATLQVILATLLGQRVLEVLGVMALLFSFFFSGLTWLFPIGIFLLIYAFSIVIHELGHIIAFRFFSSASAIFVVHGLHFYTLRPYLSSRIKNFVVIAMGAGNAFFVCVLLGLLSFMVGGSNAAFVGMALCMVACLHIVLLFLSIGDGKNLWKTLID